MDFSKKFRRIAAGGFAALAALTTVDVTKGAAGSSQPTAADLAKDALPPLAGTHKWKTTLPDSTAVTCEQTTGVALTDKNEAVVTGSVTMYGHYRGNTPNSISVDAEAIQIGYGNDAVMLGRRKDFEANPRSPIGYQEMMDDGDAKVVKVRDAGSKVIADGDSRKIRLLDAISALTKACKASAPKM